ncbi:CheR family methyltransferase [Novipirellula sp. SH528]|uniref:CheR family methyltransferase n=1 Tax=Novipirellula sp. SH528 TaxID=3454466 RepID=UPI003FA096D9
MTDTSYRKNMILRRIGRRMGLHHLEHLQQYVERLKEDPKEATALYRDLLISVTAFFRDPEAYQELSDQLLPELTNRDVARFPFRVWVPGCATGEEAYSLALLLIECLDGRSDAVLQQPTSTRPIQVFASDVDEAAIVVARAGVYPSSIASDVSQERLDRFFTKADEAHYQIGKQLRESVVFSRQNLIYDPPFSKLDLISCRNLLIYLEPEMQRKVISLFHFALADDGVLMLGPSESIAHADHLFGSISKKWRIFKKVVSSRRSGIPFPLVATHGPHGRSTMQLPSIAPRQGYKELVEKALISNYSPASVLVNRRYEVLYLTGPLVDYFEFPAGEPNHNLLSMCRPGLRSKLRFACQKSVAEDTDAEIEAKMKRGDDTIVCTVHVRVIKTRMEAESLMLISFADKSRIAAVSRPAVLSESPNAESSSYANQLERELKSHGEELGGVIEELEGANEDLKNSNEEIMSMNEELQSANEELETSKEELQSLNEELSTVNSELLEKVTELDVANNDILNLLASTEIATLFLDGDLQIQRFTPPTVKLLNLRSTDIGRPFSDITTRFIDDCLLSDCRKVIRESTPIQSTIEGDDSRMYLRRILPYRSHGDQILGVVITFIDLTERLLLEKSLQESKEHLEAILDSAADAILTIDDEGTIASLNPATERMFGYPREHILGKSILSLLTSTDCNRLIRVSSIQHLPISESGIGNYLELIAKRKDGTGFDAELTVSRIDHLSLLIVVIRDVSQRKELQNKVLEIASDEQRRIGQELHDGTQQELTGLSLIAGTIEDFFNQRIQTVDDHRQTLALDHADVSRLMFNVSKLVQGLKEANQHVQSLSHGIMPVQIDAEGLHSALTELASDTTVEDKVVCSFVHSGSMTIESNNVATHLYRIAQEAINNAQRHGGAKDICVSLSADEHQILLEVSDDGVGMDASSMNAGGKLNQGAGLQIMEYRASVIGGSVSILAGQNSGAIVRCTIPRQRKLG